MWEGLSKSQFQWNTDFLDLGLHFNGLFDLKTVPKLTYGGLWGSKGHPWEVFGAGLDLDDF